jgi:hypothetical protein
MFAAALGIAVAVYSSVSLSCLASFTAHVGIVRCLAFSRGYAKLRYRETWINVERENIEESGWMAEGVESLRLMDTDTV